MKKLLNIGMISTFVFGLVFAVSPAEKAFALSYDGTNPITTGCSSDGVTKASKHIIDSNGYYLGTVYLKYSYKCQTSWAYMKLTNAAPIDAFGNATVYSYTSSVTKRTSYSCSSSGGNGRINHGQISCHSAQVYNGVGYKAYAFGAAGGGTAKTTWY
ncbi:YjfA family protein [Bacillus sp. R1-10]